MCGIVGILGKPTFRMRKVYEDMLQLDVLRGSHSTGIAAFGDKRQFLMKSTGLPQQLLKNDKYDRNVVKKWSDYRCIIGHNRLATEGKIVKRNAHPFNHGHITLMHNGTLHTKLDTGEHEFDTDSEGIAWSIAHRGIEETWKQLSGAAAIAWWDNSDKTLNFITNGQRPIAFTQTKDGEQALFASEAWMMTVAAARNNFDIAKPVSPKDNVLFTFSYNEKTKSVEHIAMEVKPKWPSASTYQNRNHHHHHHHGGSGAGHQGQGTFPNVEAERARKRAEADRQEAQKVLEHKPADPKDARDAELTRQCEEIGKAIADWQIGQPVPWEPERDGVVAGGEKSPVNLSNPGDSGTHVKRNRVSNAVRFIDPKTHRFNHATLEYEPKTPEREELDSLGDKIDKAQDRRKSQGTLMLPRPEEKEEVKVFGRTMTMDHPSVRQALAKTISEKEFHDKYSECSSCDGTLDGDYEEALIISDESAICGTCVTVALHDGLDIEDVINSAKGK